MSSYPGKVAVDLRRLIFFLRHGRPGFLSLPQEVSGKKSVLRFFSMVQQRAVHFS